MVVKDGARHRWFDHSTITDGLKESIDSTSCAGRFTLLYNVCVLSWLSMQINCEHRWMLSKLCILWDYLRPQMQMLSFKTLAIQKQNNKFDGLCIEIEDTFCGSFKNILLYVHSYRCVFRECSWAIKLNRERDNIFFNSLSINHKACHLKKSWGLYMVLTEYLAWAVC